MKQLADYIDSKGFVGHFSDEGVLEFGDGLQRISMEALFRFLLAFKTDGIELAVIFISAYTQRYLNVFLPTGEPTRHWDRSQWYGQAGTCSRDQLRPTFLALAAMGMVEELISLWVKLAKRGFFAWNTKHIGQWDDKWKVPDFVGFAPLHSLLRGCMRIYPYLTLIWLFLLVTDFLILINVIFRVAVGYIDRDDSSNDLNLTCDLLFIKQIGYQTPFSWLAHELYFGLMPVANVSDPSVKVSPIGVVSRFQNYFAGPNHPPLDVLAQEAILKLS